jgi:hypothetical protein
MIFTEVRESVVRRQEESYEWVERSEENEMLTRRTRVYGGQ